MPPLALSVSQNLTLPSSDTKKKGNESENILDSVFEMLSNAALNTLPKSEGSESQDLKLETILSTILGLGIKRGSLCQILNAIRLLITSGEKNSKKSVSESKVENPPTMFLSVSLYLKELAEAKAEMDALELDLINYKTGDTPLTWVTG